MSICAFVCVHVYVCISVSTNGCLFVNTSSSAQTMRVTLFAIDRELHKI